MNLIDKIFGKGDKLNLTDKSPSLAPWYFRLDNPKLLKDEEVLRWKAIGSNGITSLRDITGNCYGLVGMACYLLPSNDSKSFLVWDRSPEKSLGLQPIKMFYYECDKLQPIIERDKAISKMDREKSKLHFAVEPTAKVEFSFNPKEEAMKFYFPDEFKQFEEFILLTELENLYHNPDSKNYWHNTTMLLIKTESGWVFNYPQDWFNKSNSDFGYQWITRAIRNPKTNLIHGQGIRISDFVLDKSNKQLLR